MWSWDSRVQPDSGHGWTWGTCKPVHDGADISAMCIEVQRKLAWLERRETRHTETFRDENPHGLKEGVGALVPDRVSGCDSSSLGNSAPSLLFHETIWILMSDPPFFHLHENEFISIICNFNNLKELKKLTGQMKIFKLYFRSSGDSMQPVSQWAAPKLKGNVEMYLVQHLIHT